MNHLDHYLRTTGDRVNSALDELFVSTGHPETIYRAMSYSVMAGGKRLRPILLLATAESLGAPTKNLTDLACAVELVHTYSLIHDDLPAMDDSDLRRGKPSCHRAFGEAIAILAGDALLTMAFGLVADYGLLTGNYREALEIGGRLSRAAGVEGMIGGQVLDLMGERKRISLPELKQMYRRKTGALIEAAVIIGALTATPSPDQLAALSGYASRLGLAFQIVDDLLDREGTAEQTGKPHHADESRFKSTYPALMGVEPARQEALKLYEQALFCLESLGESGQLLKQLARYLVFRDK